MVSTIFLLFFYNERKIDKYGLVNDRKWVIVKAETNRFVTMRGLPQMSLIVPTVEENFLVLNAPGMEEIKVTESVTVN
jgi:uncharacterized protein YcbX